MNRSLAGDEEGLVGYWPFHDTAGSSTADDATENNNIGTLYNGAAVVAGSTVPVNLVSWWRAEGNANDSVGPHHGTPQNGLVFGGGILGQGFSFDGGDDYITGNATSFPLGNSARTITAWVKTTSTSTQAILHYGGTDGTIPPNNFHLFIASDQGSGKAAIGNGWGHGTVLGTSDIADGQWHFLAGVYEGSGTNVAKIYVDGAEQADAQITEAATAAGAFEIGRFINGIGGGLFNGTIDEVEIYNRALTTDEIAAVYAIVDTTPDQFTFTDQTAVSVGAVASSNAVTVSGINTAVFIGFTDCTGTVCQYRINGGDWTIADGTVNNGDTVEVRQTAAGSYSTQSDLTLKIGPVFDVFSVTTGPAPQYTLTVTRNGTETGSVTGGEVCTFSWIGDIGTCTVDEGAVIALSATADAGAIFTGWTQGSGSASGCSGTGNCIFSITQNSAITGSFAVNHCYYTPGDVDNNGTIDLRDVILALQIAAGIE